MRRQSMSKPQLVRRPPGLYAVCLPNTGHVLRDPLSKATIKERACAICNTRTLHEWVFVPGEAEIGERDVWQWSCTGLISGPTRRRAVARWRFRGASAGSRG
jgi:hypothetical protein